MKLIDKDAVLAIIEKRMQRIYPKRTDYTDGQKSVLVNLSLEINTLEVKEVDLEKETKKWWKEQLHLNPENKLWMDAHQSIVFAKHFFELGLKTQKGE